MVPSGLRVTREIPQMASLVKARRRSVSEPVNRAVRNSAYSGVSMVERRDVRESPAATVLPTETEPDKEGPRIAAPRREKRG